MPRRPIAKTCGGADVTAVSSTIVAGNPSRLLLVITNNSDADVSLELETATGLGTAVVNEGVVLKANGGSFATDAYTGPVAAITATGTKRVAVLEV